MEVYSWKMIELRLNRNFLASHGADYRKGKPSYGLKPVFFPRASERRVLPIVGVCISSSHLHIFSSSDLLICSSSHLLLVTPSHPHIFSSSHILYEFSK